MHNAISNSEGTAFITLQNKTKNSQNDEGKGKSRKSQKLQIGVLDQ